MDGKGVFIWPDGRKYEGEKKIRITMENKHLK